MNKIILASVVVILITIIIIFFFARTILFNEANFHFLRYHARKGVKKSLTGIKNWAMGDKPRPVDKSKLRLNSEKLPASFTEYSKIIQNTIMQEIYKHKNSPFLPALIDAVEGGKRIRGSLMLSIVKGARPEYMDASAKIASCIEVIHCASLVFDDIMDGDIYRRDKPSIYYKYGIGHAQMAGMILLSISDALLKSAFDIRDVRDDANNSSDGANNGDNSPAPAFTAEKERAIRDYIDKATRALINGQALDIEADSKNISDEGAKILIEDKTASLFEASIMIGYIIARDDACDDMHCDDMQYAQVQNASREYGVAFQIADDFDDIEQDAQSKGGKQKNHILRYGKAYGETRLEEISKNCTDVFTSAGIMNDDIGATFAMMRLK